MHRSPRLARVVHAKKKRTLGRGTSDHPAALYDPAYRVVHASARGGCSLHVRQGGSAMCSHLRAPRSRRRAFLGLWCMVLAAEGGIPILSDAC